LTVEKNPIAAAFGAAAEIYSDRADIQREVAEELAARIGALPIPPAPRILEIGCGTGFLTRALGRRFGNAHWVVTDLSFRMVARCRGALDMPMPAQFLVMDGQRPSLQPAGGFDLICSSLAFQWFDALEPALDRLSQLLAPGGHLAFATLAQGSLDEWHHACAACGLVSSVRAYPTPEDIAALWPTGGSGWTQSETLVRRHPDAHAFLSHLREIGANSAAGRPPLSPGSLRRVLRRFERPAGITAHYRIVYGIYRAPNG
jgi:malonyl-CoA O-methyltransferase